MKRFMITTALVAGMSTAAFAQETNIEASVNQYFTTQGMDYDASALTEEQLDAVYQVVTSTESPADQQTQIEALIGTEANVTVINTVPGNTGEDQLRTSVMQGLTEEGISDIDVSMLSNAQLTGIYDALNSEMSALETKNRIDALVASDTSVDADMPAMDTVQLRESVSVSLTQWGYDVEVDALSDQQVNDLYLALNSGSDSEKRKSVDEILMQ
ncbi:MAG: hypothetical protein ABNH26_05895 [Celeribacter sp.]|jgi:hypothetical protein